MRFEIGSRFGAADPALCVTLRKKASMEGNLSTELLKEIAAYLAPDASLQ